MANYIYVSGSNYFNEEDLNKMIELLEQGETIRVGIDCIGHTRNNMEQEAYKEALIRNFAGEKELEIKLLEGVCSYSYEYKLRKED